jgi:uncharacterized membrane protein YkoI
MKRRYMTLVIVLAGAGIALCIGAVATQQLGEAEISVSIDQVPAAVKAALLAAARGGTIREIEMETENGQAVYEADVVLDGKEVEVRVSADGTVLGKEADDENEDEDADDVDEEENDDGDVQISLAEAPEAVKATILKEAAGAEIKEIEKETEDGQVIYSAELVAGGQETDIEVAPDGKLLGKEVEDEDDE